MGAGALLNVGYMCLVVSVWGSIQLVVMGFFYSIEAVTLYEDAEPHGEYGNYTDFIKLVEKNYAALTSECFVAAIIFFVFIFLSILSIRVANEKLKKEAILLEDDDKFCTPTRFY